MRVGIEIYRCEATTLGGFVQQLAVQYVARGYRFYVTGQMPDRKDPLKTDAKLIDRYGIAVSKAERARRKLAGRANLHYLRFGRFFVLIATKGRHRFFDEEGDRIEDCGRVSIKVRGYAIGLADGHARVQIEHEEYKRQKAYLTDLAVSRSRESLEAEFRRLRFEPYAPVRRQLLVFLRAVNRARGGAGFEPVPKSCLRLKRHIYRPFDPIEVAPYDGFSGGEEPPLANQLTEE